MSTSGLTNQYIPNTLDGLNVIEADQVYINGQPVELDNLVPYTGANKTINAGIQAIKTSYNPVALDDVINLDKLNDVVTGITGGVSANFLNKTTNVDQTVQGAVEFLSTVTSSNFYANNGYYIPKTTATTHGWRIARQLNGSLLKDLLFRDTETSTDCLLLSEEGQTVYVGLTCAYGTASKVPIWDANKKLVSSGVDSVKITYLDNVSSDIQTQLNGKLNLSGSNANQNIVIGSYKVQSSAVPLIGDDYTNKTYVDGAISGAGSLYVLKAGDTMTGALAMGANKITTTYTPINADDLTRKGYVDTQLALKANLAGGNTITGNQTFSDNTASTVAIFDASKNLKSSTVTTTTLSYLDATSSIQTQLNSKANTSALANYVLKAGDTMSGALQVNSTLGVTDTVSIGIAGLTANTTANIKFSSSASHIDNNPGEVYLFTGYEGHIGIQRNTTRDSSTACLVLGTASTEESEIISIKANNSAFMPLSFAASRYTFTSGNVGIGTTADTSLYVNGKGKFHDGTVGVPANGINGGTGTRVVLWPGGASDTPYALGINAGTMWYGVPSGAIHAWYEATTERMRLTGGKLGVGTTSPEGDLHVKTAGAVNDYWGKLVVKTTSFWGDGTSVRSETAGTQYATMFPMMFINPHVVSDSDGFCRIRIGRAGGVASGRWWEVATRSDGAFDIGAEATDYLVMYPWGSMDFKGGNGGTWGKDYAKQPGTLIIGRGDTNYGGQTLTNNNNLAGFLMECLDNTEIQIHDSGNRVASFMYYSGNTFLIGRDSGWGVASTVIEGPMYIRNPPQQYRGWNAGFGSVLGWDVYDNRVTINVIEYYHNGPYNNLIQGNWGNTNRTTQVYKSSTYQCLLITGFVTAYTSVAGMMGITIRLYNQSTGQYFYFYTFQFYNVTYNHCPILINIDASQIPAGWYDTYYYTTYGNQLMDGNDVLSITYQLFPNGVTSP